MVSQGLDHPVGKWGRSEHLNFCLCSKPAKTRSLLCYWAAGEIEIGMTRLNIRLKLSVFAMSNAASRGEDLAKASGYYLEPT